MYILPPILILLAAIVGIWTIISRKFVYLKKLTPEAISDPVPSTATFWADLFPEVVDNYKKIQWREYRLRITSEFEKMLRRVRLVFLKIDDLTHRLIRRLRRSTERQVQVIDKEEETKIIEEQQSVAATTIDPKEEEQHLIMEIAKNPKDTALYIKLGDVYLKTGDNENARLSYKTVLDLDPENWYAGKKLEELS